MNFLSTLNFNRLKNVYYFHLLINSYLTRNVLNETHPSGYTKVDSSQRETKKRSGE